MKWRRDRSAPPAQPPAEQPTDGDEAHPETPEALEKAETPEAKSRPAGSDRVYVGTGFYWPVLFGLVLALAILALVLQNTDRVDVHWLWFDFRLPLIVLLLATGLSATLLTELVGWVWRRRRRRALRDREELKRLRG